MTSASEFKVTQGTAHWTRRADAREEPRGTPSQRSRPHTRYAEPPRGLEALLLSSQHDEARDRAREFLGETLGRAMYPGPNMLGVNVLAGLVMGAQEGALAAVKQIVGHDNVVEGTSADLGYEVEGGVKVVTIMTQHGPFVVGFTPDKILPQIK